MFLLLNIFMTLLLSMFVFLISGKLILFEEKSKFISGKRQYKYYLYCFMILFINIIISTYIIIKLEENPTAEAFKFCAILILFIFIKQNIINNIKIQSRLVQEEAIENLKFQSLFSELTINELFEDYKPEEEYGYYNISKINNENYVELLMVDKRSKKEYSFKIIKKEDI